MRKWRFYYFYFVTVLGLTSLNSVHAVTGSIDFSSTANASNLELISTQFYDQGVIFENPVSENTGTEYDAFLDTQLSLMLEFDYGYTITKGIHNSYGGPIQWGFIDPETGASRSVDRVTINTAADFTDYKYNTPDRYIPSTLEAFDKDGVLIDSMSEVESRELGYYEDSLTVTGKNIHRVKLKYKDGVRHSDVNFHSNPGIFIVRMEYEYDLTPTATLLFRENRTHAINTFWGPIFGGGSIPGWDHVGLNVDDKVYESHPGYNVDNEVYASYPNGAGTYVSVDGREERTIPREAAVQAYHSRNTFTHNALKVLEPETPSLWREIEIDYELGKDLEQKITEVMGASYIDLSGNRLEQLLRMGTENQKGAGGTFSCVGLVEWAAESIGHNESEGFIPNAGENYFITPDEMAYWVDLSENNSAVWEAFKDSDYSYFIDGFADPVDFIITDPLGRRLGHTAATGALNEIPFAYYSGNGPIERFFIPVTVPGEYSLDLVGLGEKAVVEMISGQHNSIQVDQLMAEGEESSRTLNVSVDEHAKGDVNHDGELTVADVTLLITLLGQTVTTTHPGDLDGDAAITETDVELLEELVEYMEPELTCAGLTPTITGTAGDDVIYGTEGDDVIKAFAGNDTVYGLGGNDTICGGAGNDDLRGGEGDDHIRGNRGSDFISGNEGNDTLRGGRGADQLRGGKGADKLYGRRGSDSLNGGKGFDICKGGKGNDTAEKCERARSAR